MSFNLTAPRGIIALDLDGTLLNSNKELSSVNRAALERAAAAGYVIVPTTGRFFDGMPEVIRTLPFVRYAITCNGAAAEDVLEKRQLYRAEIPWEQAVKVLAFLDGNPLIYDCYIDNAAWMTAAMKELIDDMVTGPHSRDMLHRLRQPVPELKAFITERKQNVQKIQMHTQDTSLREKVREMLDAHFPDLVTASSLPQNVEINHKDATKGKALLVLAEHLGVPVERVFAMGDSDNDLSMIAAAGMGIAMGNAKPAVKEIANAVTLTNNEDGVAHAIETYCL